MTSSTSRTGSRERERLINKRTYRNQLLAPFSCADMLLRCVYSYTFVCLQERGMKRRGEVGGPVGMRG